MAGGIRVPEMTQITQDQAIYIDIYIYVHHHAYNKYGCMYMRTKKDMVVFSEILLLYHVESLRIRLN